MSLYRKSERKGYLRARLYRTHRLRITYRPRNEGVIYSLDKNRLRAATQPTNPMSSKLLLDGSGITLKVKSSREVSKMERSALLTPNP